MLQKIESITKEQFLKDVDSLRLRFPGRQITEATGYNKGQVSRYLSGADMPSVNFLKKFYEKFESELQKVTQVDFENNPDMNNTELIQALREQIEQLKEINSMLKQKLKTDLGELKEDHVLMQAQLKILMELMAKWFAHGNKKEEERNRFELNKTLGEYVKAGMTTDNR